MWAVSLSTPLFISLLHKTATVPRRGPSSLVWWGPGAVYSTVQPSRRPCAWGRGNAPRTLQNHEYFHFRTPTKRLILQQFHTFPRILLSVSFIAPPARPAFPTRPLRVRVRLRCVSRSPSSLRALVSEYRKVKVCAGGQNGQSWGAKGPSGSSRGPDEGSKGQSWS